MAKKVVKRTAPKDDGDNDLDILHPSRTLKIAGQMVTVREYGFVEGLRLHKTLAPFMEAVYGIARDPKSVKLDFVLGAIADNLHCVLPAIADAADVDMDFINSLSEAEGYDLIYTWWAINGPFFWRRAHARIQSEALEKILSAGQTFTQPSSPAATPPSESAITPSGK